MATPPPFSVFSASSELLVTASVFYVLGRAYWRDDLRKGLLLATLAFEAFVNIAYMVYRVARPSTPAAQLAGWQVALQGTHGILSLVMFLGLVWLGLAAVALRKDRRNLFREMPRLTLAFVVLWSLSVASGEFIFVSSYLV